MLTFDFNPKEKEINVRFTNEIKHFILQLYFFIHPVKFYVIAVSRRDTKSISICSNKNIRCFGSSSGPKSHFGDKS